MATLLDELGRRLVVDDGVVQPLEDFEDPTGISMSGGRQIVDDQGTTTIFGPNQTQMRNEGPISDDIKAEIELQEAEAALPRASIVKPVQRNIVNDLKVAEQTAVALKTEGDTLMVQNNPSSLKSKLGEAISMFAPDLIGGILAGVVGGTEASAMGFSEGGKIRGQLTKIDQFNQEMELQNKRFGLSQEQQKNNQLYQQKTLDLQERSLAQRTAADERDFAAKIASINAKAQNASLGLSKGQLEVDKAFAKNYADRINTGEVSDTTKLVNQLEEAKNILRQSSGGAAGPLVSLVPDSLRARLPGLSEGVRAEDYVTEVVQRNLRATLGAQFTEKEGERLIKRAYNARMPEAENIRRIERLQQQIVEAAENNAKATEYFEANGTLKGFQGKLFNSADDFSFDEDPKMKRLKELEAREGK